MTVYVENPKELTKHTPVTIKVAGYKVNIQKSITFQYTNNEQVEFEIKNTIPSTLIPPKLKYLDINLTT